MAEELINKFNLPLDRKPCSGQRRVFKLAFFSEAKSLLLNEPTSNLENSKIVKDMIGDYDGTVIFASPQGII